MSTAPELHIEEPLLYRLTLDSLLRRTFRVMRIGAPQILAISLLVILPFIIISILLVVSDLSDYFASIPYIGLLYWLIGLSLVPLVSGALAHPVFDLLQGRECPPVGKSLGLAVRRLPSLVLASIVAYLLTALGFLLCIIPGFIVAAGLFVFIPVIMVEKAGPIRALSRSWDLTVGYRLWICLFLFLVVASELVLTIFFDMMFEASTYLWIFFLAASLGVMFAPLVTVACASTVAYHDSRLAQEGVEKGESLLPFD